MFRNVHVRTFLGFFGTDDDFSAGNYGLRDQIAALRWVSNEIQAFGGDQSMVTIFGHDAGGISVSILTLSHEARGKRIFKKAVIDNLLLFASFSSSLFSLFATFSYCSRRI